MNKKPMKRKIDPNKVYAFIGRAVTGLGIWILSECAIYKLAIYVLDNCITTI